MLSILVFLGLLAVIAAWWLAKQGIASKPWMEQGVAYDTREFSPAPSPAKIGFGVFLAVVGTLFALFISAYAMRMQLPDWRAPPIPQVVWLNTIMLILSSVALQGARTAARRDDADALKIGLAAGGLAALAFLSGQLLAWRQLMAEGYWLATNSADAFFYILTGVHGIHLLGGLIALASTGSQAWRGTPPQRLLLSVDLCATYWHFLLLVWLILLSVLIGWAGEVAAICRQLLT
ncbi:cytochrome c oxidase subunit 3 [Microvirga puerhi]|uniref:Cytochrome c oxidase subunit 3 n=1 Tax=Microvirga puerhi TaxID=2876078 RepID=A0ABS7VNT1_9HYPH|nr:cytochrome c oxidase subunit 3 [Microvirga puerhi]MBZ6076801.1 cytochrome c oxidase subunit 3 [Microvirga puerhi]